MSQTPSDSSDSAKAGTDHSALAWVLGEVRTSLAQSAKLLRRFARDTARHRAGEMAVPPDVQMLEQAKLQLHQVTGALELIGQDAAVQMLKAMEAAVLRARGDLLSEAGAVMLERAGHGLVEFLQAQLAGKASSSVALFPQYLEVQALAGVQKIHPADLWLHEWQWARDELGPDAPPLAYDGQTRERLDRALLRIVRQSDPVAAVQLQALCLGLAASQGEDKLRHFWWLGAAFFEALGQRLCPIDVYAKRTVSLVFHQYTALARGETEVSERLAHLLLFSCAQSGPVTPARAPVLAAVRAAYGLADAQAVSYTQSPYGRFDPALLGLARRRIRLVKDGWTALASGESPQPQQVREVFVQLAESIVQLHADSLPLAQTLVRAVESVQQQPSPELGMEVATAVLYLEAVLEDGELEAPLLSQRTARLAERIQHQMGTGQSEPLESWMEDLYRRVSDRQTMGSVVGELRLLLVDVEKALDQYFRQPGASATLREVPNQLGQMRGVLSVLGLEPAVRAVRSMRDSLEPLFVAEHAVDLEQIEQLFAKLAANLGALGLMLDMLNDQPALVRKLFVYDDALGELQLRMGRSESSQPTRDRVDPATDLDAVKTAPSEPAAHADSPAAETPAPELQMSRDEERAELHGIFLEEAADVVQRGREALALLQHDLGDAEQLAVLRRAFHTLKGSSRMVGLSDFGEAAWALEQVLNTCLAGTRKASPDMLALSGQALDTLSQWAQDLAQGQAQHWRSDALRAAAQALTEPGSLSPVPPSALEQSEQSEQSEPAAVLAVAEAVLSDAPAQDAAPQNSERWPGEPEGGTSDAPSAPAPSPIDPAELAQAGARDDAFAPTALAATAPAPQEGEGSPTALEPGAQAVTPEPKWGEDLDLDLDLDLSQAPTPAPESAPATEIANETAPETAIDSAPEPVLAMAPAQASDLADEERPVEAPIEAPSAAEAASPATAQAPELPLSLATLAEPVTALEAEGLGEAQDRIDEQVKVIGDLRVGIPLYNVFLSEADEWSRGLVSATAEWALELQHPLSDSAVALAHSLAGSSATVGFTRLSGLARALEHAMQHVQLMARGTPEQARLFIAAAEEIRQLLHQFAAGFLKVPNEALLAELQALLHLPVSASYESSEAEASALAPLLAPSQAVRLIDDDEIDAKDSLDPELFDIFREEAQELLPQLAGAMRQWLARPEHGTAASEILRLLHTLKGGARLCGAMRLGEMAHHMETAVQALPAQAPHPADLDLLQQRQDQLQACFEGLCAGQLESNANAQTEATPSSAQPDSSVGDAPTASQAGMAQADPTPAALAPPPAAPDLPVADAVPERPVPPQSLSASLARAEAGAAFSGTLASGLPSFTAAASGAAAALAVPRAQDGPAVRVRTRLMDRLLNQAGEVMTSRLRMDNNVNSLRQSLADLSGNLERLRQQLRELDLQAELQMQSRMAQTRESEQAFDPLEFDRFTRVQELTRMLAESVDDVATVQRNLGRSLDAAENDLANQARQARDLQRDLLRTRMVEFESLSERLYRVVRQAGKDTGKRVQMDIEGGAIEIDRSVLERMTPAFEHLLRNAVAHGIEPMAQRQASGKPEAGSITIVLQQEGNDVAISFVDDGAGFDLARIRERALALGLQPEGAADVAPEHWTEAQLISLVFQAGLSTAEQVSALAGRGIGMDVVRADVNALGGRIEAQTERGRGSRFKLVLPLTTAITQVVMLRVGRQVMGVPASLIERVRRESLDTLAAAQRSGEFSTAAGPVPFYWAGALLHDSPQSLEIGQAKTAQVVLVRSAAQTVALLVDEVLGNKEVVVKNLGPQLARIPGLAGLSIMPDGEVALIYNPVALAQVYGDSVRAWQAQFDAPAPTDAGVTGKTGAEPAAAADLAPLVMVVDDSITVRRVTQRLLQREGFRVVLAYDGMQALEKLIEERPSVILSDIEMPRMDGFDLVRNLKANDDWAELPVIMITSRIAEKHRARAQELGVQHYLGKPYSEDELLQLIRHYTQQAPALHAQTE